MAIAATITPEVKKMSAVEMFTNAARASADAEYLRRRIERMEASEGLRGASLTGSVRSSSPDANGMSRVDARIDFERIAHDRIEEDYALIDYACAVLYGRDGKAGIASLLGIRPADLLWYHYLDGKGWDAAAVTVGCSRSTAFREKNQALDLIDMLGFERVIAGVGHST